MFDHIHAFERPRTIEEALRLLHEGGEGGRFVAGGTDVIVQADRSIRFLVDITRLGLSYIRRDQDKWSIGATTTMAELENSPAIRALAGGILAKAASTCGSVQIRNKATLGGNLANASPAADMATPLLALDAVAIVAGPAGRRSIPLAEFFSAPGKSSLDGALLVEVVITAPPRAGRAGWSFQKLGRTQSDISLVSVAAGLAVDPQNCVQWARMALGAVAPTPVRALNAEQLLAGRRLEKSLVEEAAAQAARDVSPLGDVRASAGYRREMSGVLARRALAECASEAGRPL